MNAAFRKRGNSLKLLDLSRLKKVVAPFEVFD